MTAPRSVPTRIGESRPVHPQFAGSPARAILGDHPDGRVMISRGQALDIRAYLVEIADRLREPCGTVDVRLARTAALKALGLVPEPEYGVRR